MFCLSYSLKKQIHANAYPRHSYFSKYYLATTKSNNTFHKFRNFITFYDNVRESFLKATIPTIPPHCFLNQNSLLGLRRASKWCLSVKFVVGLDKLNKHSSKWGMTSDGSSKLLLATINEVLSTAIISSAFECLTDVLPLKCYHDFYSFIPSKGMYTGVSNLLSYSLFIHLLYCFRFQE